MRRALLLMMTGALACGGDDGGGTGSGDGLGDAGQAQCADLSGNWTIASHCNDGLDNMSVPVTQTGCTIATGGTFAGLSGPVARDGTIMLTGTIDGTALTCTGKAVENQIVESCSGCDVVLKR